VPRFHHKVEVNAEPERAWAVLGDLTQADRWIPGTTQVVVEGTSKRVCTFIDGHVQHEEISDYSAVRRSYRYAIEGSPGMQRNCGVFRVEKNGHGSVVLWDSAFEAIDPAQEAQIAAMWEEAAGVVLESLRRRIEEET
jgi:carbon monoxide dehydrogenase subunit G